MKKFAYCLMASLICFQSSYALETIKPEKIELGNIETHILRQQVGATSNFTESAREMEAILNAIADGDFPVVLPSEFAVTLFRETEKVDTIGKVKYILETCSKIDKNNNCKKINKYRVTIRVEHNGIGPNAITVLKVKRIG